MPHPSYNQSQRFLATLLLFSLLLESCHNPNIGIGKRSIAVSKEAAQPGPAISPQRPILADKAPQHTANQGFIAQGGQQGAENSANEPSGRGKHQREPVTGKQGSASGSRPIESRQASPNSEQAQEQPAQQGAQAKGKEKAAAIVEVNEEPAQSAQPAIILRPPSQADKTPQHTASQGVLAQGGQQGKGCSAGGPSGRDQHQRERPTREQGHASGSKLINDPPRALELTESKEPTDLKGAQQEAAKLKAEIAKLYSTLPQATEEADAKVVDELVIHLKALLKLEGFWTLAQGSDGAKEYIARVREAYRTKWGKTEDGARVSKQLTALLVQACGQELKRLASERRVDKQGKTIKSKTPDGAGRLAKVLGQLAALHQEQGEETGDLAYYTDAAILYQNILTICEEKKDKQEQTEAAYRGLVKIRRAMLARMKRGQAGVVAQGDLSIAKLQEEIAGDKKVLQNLRVDAKKRVAQLEALLSKQGSHEEELTYEKEYVKESRALFSDIAKQVREFLARLYQESEEELSPVLGPSPCKYTVIGLGSMALRQMTPYSDLEFAILMEEGKDKADEAPAREYLRQLTHLVHFRVINLGETVIPKDKYEVNLDHLGKRGINFDLGGKTPLGRKDKPYDLIQPVAGMLHYLRNEGDKIEHIDKNLPYILESACHVHGDEALYSVYKGEKSVFLQQEQIHKTRALKRLQEGVVEWDYSHPGIPKAKPQQLGNLAEFKPQFYVEDAGRLYDVKQEIYRLPDRLLYGLSMYYGLVPKSGWDAVEQLAGSGIIGVGVEAQDAVHHLQYAVSFATLLRLKTYLHHGQQGEGVTMLSRVRPEETQQAASKAFLLPPEALQEGGSLFKYYYIAVPLHSKMESFFEASEGRVSPRKEHGFFQEESFYDASDATRGAIYLRLLQYKKAIEYLARALAIDEKVYGQEHHHIAESLNYMGGVWNKLGDPKKAIECFKQALAIEEKVYGPERPHVATSLNNLGGALNQLGDPKKAIEYSERALAIDEEVYGEEHPVVAVSLNNLGLAWNQLGDLKEAIECFKQALAINEKAYGSEHPRVAVSLNNLGSTWNQLAKPKKAIEHFEQALAINQKAYGLEHPSVATNLNNLGKAWDKLGNPKKAIEYLERTLAIYEKVYGKEHPMVATSLNNLGGAWEKLGNPKKAIECFKRALAIDEKVYGKEHPMVATSLNNMGRAWDQLGEPKTAIECLERALAIDEKVYGLEHPSVATYLNNLGGVWNQLGDPKKTIEYCEQALAINGKAYGGEHADVATNLNNLGKAWYQLGDPKQAIECCERALAIYEKVYGAEHPHVATSLNNLGNAWKDLGDPKKAVEYYERSLAIYEKVYGAEHPEVASSLNNLGLALDKLGDPKKAREYFERSLEIRKKVYGAGHPHVATSLNSLGTAWDQLGDPKKAVEYYERALAIYEKVYGAGHPHVATSLNSLGTAWDQLGDPKKAVEYYEQALAIDQKVYSPEHPSVATSLCCLGSAWEELGDPKKAIEYSERALAIYEKVYGEEHPNVATSLNILGSAWEELGDPKKAIECRERTLAINEKAYGPEHPNVATSLNNMGNTWGELGDPKKAFECYERALAIDQKVYGTEHSRVATSLNNMGNTWGELGDPKKAFECYERALAIDQKVYGTEHSRVATILNNMGRAWDKLRDPKKAIGCYEQALAIDQKVYGPEHPKVATRLSNLGTAWEKLGNPKKAFEYYERAFHIMKKAYGGDHPSTQAIKHTMERLPDLSLSKRLMLRWREIWRGSSVYPWCDFTN